jgi:hypothetical protein
MPLKRIIGKAIVSTVKGKKAGEATSAAMKKKAAAKKAAKANARGLKAAQGPSMAPKGYTADEARRAAMIAKKSMALDPESLLFPKQYVNELARLQKIVYGPGPTNVVSKSGRKANTPKLIKKAAKKKAK